MPMRAIRKIDLLRWRTRLEKVMAFAARGERIKWM